MTALDQITEPSLQEQLAAEIASITQPLVAHFNRIDGEIKSKERELSELRAARTQLRGVLRGIDPELVPPAYQSNGKKKDQRNRSGDKNVAQHKLDALLAWFQTHSERINGQGGIHASGIINGNGVVVIDFWDPEIGIANQTGLSKALVTLHDRNLLRLDHLGNGGAKFYKVV
jgi:hypothetical protein